MSPHTRNRTQCSKVWFPQNIPFCVLKRNDEENLIHVGTKIFHFNNTCVIMQSSLTEDISYSKAKKKLWSRIIHLMCLYKYIFLSISQMHNNFLLISLACQFVVNLHEPTVIRLMFVYMEWPPLASSVPVDCLFVSSSSSSFN